MKLATLREGGRDGRLVVVSPDHMRFHRAPAETLQAALDDWDAYRTALEGIAAELSGGGGEALDTADLLAPLPRAWQWLDGSAFPSHGLLMDRAFNKPPIETGLPLMYQGMSHRFLAHHEDVPLPDEAHGIDFEGEFGVVTGDVPMGVSPDRALGLIRLVVQINDWSLRALGMAEMKTGFGWVQAKPACSMAPVAVTPDELGESWREGRVCLPLHVRWNDEDFGRPGGAEMAFGFHDLIAHAARTRDLPAGTVIGSGTVSNADHESVGSSCIAERRGIEIIAQGAPRTDFMRFGDRVMMEARLPGAPLFGAIDQRVVRAGTP